MLGGQYACDAGGENLAPHPAVGAFGPAGNPQHDHPRSNLVDGVDDPQIADSEPPEIRVRQLRRAGRPGVDGESQDGTAKAGGKVKKRVRWPLARSN